MTGPSPRLFTGVIVLAIGACALTGWTNGLLGLVCLLLLECAIDLKALLAHAETVAKVFSVEPEPMTEERAEALTEGIMARVQAEMAQATRRPN